MAEKKNITIKEYNGTDYDTLYPETNSGQVLLDKTAQTSMGLPQNATMTDALRGVSKNELNVAVGGTMALLLHLGGTINSSKSIHASAFQNDNGFTTDKVVWTNNKKVEMLTNGQEGGSIMFSDPDVPVSGIMHPSNGVREIIGKQQWVNIFDFYPDAFGNITRLKLQTSDSATSSRNTTVKLSIWDKSNNTMIYETSTGSISHSSGADRPVTFIVDFLLDPNKKYSMKIWAGSSDVPSALINIRIKSVTFTITPIVYDNGSVIINTIPNDGYSKVVLLTHANDGDAIQAVIKFDSGGSNNMNLTDTATDLLLNGTSCKMYRYEYNVPNNVSNISCSINMVKGNVVYDYALIPM